MASKSKSIISDVPRFTVNLDEPEDKRWTSIIAAYAHLFDDVIQEMSTLMTDMFGSRLGPLIESIASFVMSGIARTGFVYYGAELKSISKVSGIPLGKLVLMQLAYELNAQCTSIVTWDHELNEVFLARTMDWELPALKNLTIEVDFQSKGKLLYRGVTWAGYVGILTGLRPNGYAVAVNFRSVGETGLKNLIQGISRAWPVGFLVREVLETEHSYSNAVSALSASELMAPVYFTVAGTKREEGVVITRNRTVEDRRSEISQDTKGYLLQCNIDQWISDEECDCDILWSLERRHVVNRFMATASVVTIAELWGLFSQKPVRNEESIYATIMVPALAELQTKIEY